ncbi:MAG TPA: FG-GAP-like repeat-containing protein, partial [Thermomicrobiales bacterium]|nr:FG-GAP-like repeat-containing protein [Thermomicrobiales bacterium]
DPDNDTAHAALDVTESVSDGPAEQLDAPGASAAAAGDFNGDGLTDLAVATKSGQGTLVFLNAADPEHANKLAFANLPLTFADTAAETGVAAADLDGDGDLDLAVARGGAPDGVLINGGQADFQAAAALGDAGSNAVAIADLNGDGLPDLVFAGSGASTVYINNGGGAFTPQALAGTANSVGAAAVDLNGDALPDLVLANADGGAELYLNSGGSFGQPVPLDTGPTTAVAAQDFNGDGLPDLVFGQAAGDSPLSRVYLNTSASTPSMLSFFEAAELGGVGTADVLAADFDLDGLNDVITINGAGGHELYTNAGGANTAFLLHPQQFVSDTANKAIAGRFNADDRPDVAVAGGDKVDIFFNDGHGNFGLGDVNAPTVTLNGQPSVTLTVGDAYTDAGATASDPE